jgi:hypothetical protein
MELCQACGTENPAASKFCIGCGKPLIAQPGEQTNLCPACGKEIVSGAKFCVGCGASLPDSCGLPKPALCPSCGAETIENTNRFCTRCGAPLAQGQALPDNGALHHDRVDACRATLEQNLSQAGFDRLATPSLLNLAGCYRRSKFELFQVGVVTSFCGISCFDHAVSAAELKSLCSGLFDYAVRNKGYLARNAFQPLVVYPVTIATACHDDVQAFLNSYWPKHWMAYEFPVVINAATKQVACNQGRPLWGLLNFDSIKKDALRLFTLP